MPTRWIALVLLPLVLAMSGGVDPACGSSGDPSGSHHGSPQSHLPATDHGPQSCPMVPGAPCTAMTGCLPAGVPLATLTPIAAPRRLHQQPSAAIRALVPRAIAPALPPPRA